MQPNIVLNEGQPRLHHLITLNHLVIEITLDHHNLATTKKILASDSKNLNNNQKNLNNDRDFFGKN